MKALFLDRDGVIIDYVPYLSKPEQVKIPDDAGIALKKWQDAGYCLVIITNQSGVGRGYFTMKDVKAIHELIFQKYAQFGVQFAEVLICPHHPQDNCYCRKPSPSLLLDYATRKHIELTKSYFIGDAPSDLECAIASNCQPILILTGRGKETVKMLSQYKLNIPVFNSLQETTKIINAQP
jgi:D-glycero-D-manno-heptose 1,7-bisphosphate phosphatase